MSNAFLGVATAWCRAEARVCRSIGSHAILDSMQRMSGATLAAALSRHEKSRLTLGIYDASPVYGALADELFSIEEKLFNRELPKAPASVLVGACGTGREAIALAARGYRVQAFDPAPAFVAECGRRMRDRLSLAQLSYEALSELVLDNPRAHGQFAQTRFNAVVLGCGSLSHVLDANEQRRLFQTLDVLCPSGPWLASFLWVNEAPGELFVGRAARWGGRIGRTLARLRGMPCDVSAQLGYQAERGFAYTYTQREIEQLAQAVGRRVIWERDGERSSHYASFVPT
jgi:SAM-dependent methyltransferase